MPRLIIDALLLDIAVPGPSPWVLHFALFSVGQGEARARAFYVVEDGWAWTLGRHGEADWELLCVDLWDCTSTGGDDRSSDPETEVTRFR
jgi:hypothetical protein